MDFEIFKKHIERIQQTEEKEEILSKCIEDNLATSTRCIIDISGDVPYFVSMVFLSTTSYVSSNESVPVPPIIPIILFTTVKLV